LEIKVAIHQPDFFPWCGFFNKYHNSDIFVINDYGQFPKNATDYTCRTKIIIEGKPAWINIPISHKYQGFRRYSEMEIINNWPWRRKICFTMQTYYAKHPYFNEIFSIIKELISVDETKVIDYNINILNTLIGILDISKPKIIFGSTLQLSDSVKTEMIIEVVKAVGGTTYLSGIGGREYQNEELFKSEGIKLEYNDYILPNYAQKGVDDFVYGLSIIDTLFNCGIEKTIAIIKNNGI